MGELVWTTAPPKVPGDYLYAYRWGPGDPWIRAEMWVAADGGLEVDPDAPETLWLGPIPELPGPAKGGDE